MFGNMNRGLDLHITKIADPIDLADAALKLRSSSNFRFAWQFYEVGSQNRDTTHACRSLLAAVVTDPALHEFLKSSMDNIYPRDFEIAPLHEHCEIRECTEDFIDTFARGVFDHLGAYSRHLIKASPREREYVQRIFSPLGDFLAYSIFPGEVPGCLTCKQYNHQNFSSWFFDVAWDFTYFVAWPDRKIIWLGCFSDTD